MLAAVGAPAANAECANEQLRLELNSSHLPDCRAYEMVTPPYKEDTALTPDGYSADGDQMIFYTFGDIPPASGGGEGVVEAFLYLDTRTATGWHLSSLNAPLSEYVGQLAMATEPNSGETLWEQHTPAQSFLDAGIYSRSATGKYSFVGPAGPPRAPEEPSDAIELGPNGRVPVVAATSGYKHVLLEARGATGYWPFDATEGGNDSLYEYSGTENLQPVLVGVTGKKGEPQLIGDCGTALGGAASSVENAISTDGETIFFTVIHGCTTGPATNEVYARVHGSLASPLPAKTVHVSASACTVACGNESGKEFEGASEDGNRVFFTSTQKLTNDAVDGAESGDATTEGCHETTQGSGGCNLYEYNMTDEQLSLVAAGEVLGVADIAADGDRIYFVSRTAIPAAGSNEYGKTALPGEPNLYVFDAAARQTAFIGTLNATYDSSDWRKQFARPVEIAGENGEYFAFASASASLTPDETGVAQQIFEYDAQTSELVRASKGENGYDQNGANQPVETGLFEVQRSSTDFKLAGPPSERLLSDDGRTLVFLTTAQLSPRATSATEGCRSVYEFHTNGALAEGNVRLLSDGQDVQLFKGARCGPSFAGVDASGSNVLFATSDALLPGDTDGFQRDIYDARVEGGFPPSIGEASCEGDCEGLTSALPTLSTPASSSLTGSGNLAPPATLVPPSKAEPKSRTSKKCKPGQIRRGTKCIRKPKARAKKANSDRRTSR